MISAEIVDEIERLLRLGKSYRAIAYRTGVGRSTVRKVVEELTAYKDIPNTGKPERCGGCGAKVYKPCVFCRALAK